MDPRRETDDFFASPQVSAEDIRDAAELGIRTIINNRPDDEEHSQPRSEQLAAAARENGLRYHHIPVTADNVSDDDRAAMRRALSESPAPALGFCRTGTRAVLLWVLRAAGDHNSVDELLSIAKQSGYDLEKLRSTVDERAWRQRSSS